MIIRYFIILLLFPAPLFSQNCFLQYTHDSDAVFLNRKIIRDLSIRNLIAIENIDSSCFKNIPPLPPSVKYILHKTGYNKEGQPENYTWSFSEDSCIKMDEKEKNYGRFFISNDYNMFYENDKIKTIYVSDATSYNSVNYLYNNDSIIAEISIFNNDKTIYKSNISYASDYCNIIKKHTGIQNKYYPDLQIIYLSQMYNERLYINNVPAVSFLNGKFDKNRFLIEIRPGIYIFFEIRI